VETGIGGRYTEASFIPTIRTGRKPEGEMLSPPMPWPVYRNMTDKPVKNFVRATPVLTANTDPRSTAKNQH
jgi:hypothetical protein